jgi:predicted DNA-binding transcriptional regulator YafY
LKAHQRKLNLVAYLMHHRFGATRAVLSTDLEGYAAGEAGRKMLQRDIKALGDVGLHINMSPVSGDAEDGNNDYTYTLSRRELYAPPLRLNHAETEALTMLADHLHTHENFPLAGAAKAAFERLQEHAELLGSKNENEVDLAILDKSADHVEQETLDLLTTALIEKRALRVQYETMGSGELRDRTLEPGRLLLRDGAWYLLAFCQWRGDVREFKVERIRAATLLKDVCRHQPSHVPHRLMGEWAFGRAESDAMVRLEFDASIANWVKGELDNTIQTKVLPDGRLQVELGLDFSGRFFHWLLQWGERASIIEPPGMNEEYADWIEARLQLLNHGRAVS